MKSAPSELHAACLRPNIRLASAKDGGVKPREETVSLADLTHQSVEAALVEAASIGRAEFLKRYGFRPARRYFVEWNGARYDSKSIAGAAHGHLQGMVPLTADDFSGGEATVARRLRELGFDLPEGGERNPSWTRDELILALDLYLRFKGNPPGKSSAEIIGLSALLNSLSASRADGRSDFRNPNGVYMKLMNFRRFDPVYQAQGKSGLVRGNKLEDVVWKEFASDTQRLARTAEAIRANLDVSADDADPYGGIEEAQEGRILTRAHLVRERSRKLVEAKKAACLKATGALRCEACDFHFGAAYGERGEGFIEVHHALPIHLLMPGAKTRLSDLHLLCANCHRVVHAKRPWLTLQQLKDCVSVRRSDAHSSQI
jgi:5-methylcytosine-specific restriction enzyme A